MNVRLTLLSLLSIAFTGCSSITGLVDASDQFGCPVENGVRCTSLSQTHERLHEERRGKERIRVTASVEPSRIAPLEKKEKNPSDETSKAATNLSFASAFVDKTTQAVNPPKAEMTEGTPSTFHKAPATRHTSRVAERVMELWVLPWVDEDGDLNSEMRLWVRVRDARWGIERLRDAAMRHYSGSDAL